MATLWDRRTPSEQARVQGLATARWLPSIVRFSGHWGKLAESLQLDLEDLKTPWDIQKFPTSRERELVAAGNGATGLILRPSEEQIKSVATTSTLVGIARSLRKGGQGALRRALLEEYKPVHVHQRDQDGIAIASSRRDLDRMHLTGARAAGVLGLDDADYLVSAIPAGPTLEYWGAHHLGLGASMMTLHPRGHGDSLDAVVASFKLLPTTAIIVRADEAIELAALLLEADATIARVRTVIVMGPVPSEEERAAVADAFRKAGAPDDVAVLALWGPPDARSLWAEQRENPGALVTYPDLEHLEVIDPLTGLPSDGAGDLTISTIGWTGTALVRYQTGSYVGGLLAEPDPVTGRTIPRIVGGQVQDAWTPAVAITSEVTTRIDLRGVAAVVGLQPNITSWVFEMRGPTARVANDRLVLDLGGEVSDEQLATIKAALPDAVGAQNIKVRSVADAGKIAARVQEAGSHFVELR